MRNCCADKGLISLLLLSCFLLFAACQRDDTTAERADRLQLRGYVAPYQELPASRSVTVPDGYSPIASLYNDLTSLSVGVFLTPHETSAMQQFTLRTDGTWNSDVLLNKDSYYLYGIFPADLATSVSIASAAANYAGGAHLTLSGMPTLTTADPCVTVGVVGASSPTEDVTATQGNFFYERRSHGNNYVYLLFDHLYAALRFSIRINADYAALRTIKLKRIVLRTAGSATTDASITLRPSTTAPIDQLTFMPSAATETEVPLFTDTEGTALTMEYAPIGAQACFLPSLSSNLRLVCTYDVYDRKGNLMRPDCTAENALPLPASVVRGQRKTLQLTVNPTYLYMLSEPELDNPTFEVNE